MSPCNAVVAASRNIWSAGDHGDNFPLNINVLEEDACPVVSGYDEDGNGISYLIIVTKLFTALSGECRLFLASLLDITDFLHAVTFEDLEMRKYAKVYNAEDEDSSSIISQINLSTTNQADTTLQPTDKGHAKEMRPMLKEPGRETARSVPSPMGMGPSQTTEQLLSEFSAELLYLYKDTFILARSPLDNKLYKISHVSRSLLADGEYIRSHLKHTPADKMQLLSKCLGQNDQFDMVINWGDSGTEKRLYCAPIYCHTSRDWVCTLTDIEAPYLWRRNKT
ncbi:uncharacterized protein GIQ15_03918 [Arthroderma uncinatum]|uniref:uncharacterized protein n=1 Tax=Arthroderma uncinatum TaxID=74035 RepID=UPI00144A9D3E|nr:uncharacterized protein GIQ15_03918 [Arthroderma uncinatum]KAF3481159.1 hypothetical protein GIQ15_03918 [Arthroderma uncinatum]